MGMNLFIHSANIYIRLTMCQTLYEVLGIEQEIDRPKFMPSWTLYLSKGETYKQVKIQYVKS